MEFPFKKTMPIAGHSLFEEAHWPVRSALRSCITELPRVRVSSVCGFVVLTAEGAVPDVHKGRTS